MSGFLSQLALWLADVHLLAGALLAVVLLVMAALSQPAQRMAVAKSTLAALTALVVLCALPGWSLVHLLSAEATPPAETAVAQSISVAPPMREPMPPLPMGGVGSAPAFAPTPTPSVAPTPAVAAPPARIDWIATALLAHAIGSALVIGWLAIGAVIAGRVRRSSQAAPFGLAQALRAVVNDALAPEILTSSDVATPVALGLRRPAIILPAALCGLAGGPRPPGPGPRGGPASGPTHSELAAILAHEWAHIAAGDLRTLAATRWLLVILWPQPLFWLLRRVIRLDQETLADAAAAEVSGRVDYAEQLLGWARTAAPRMPRLAGAVGLWESPSQLKRRIATLLDEKLTILRAASRRWRIGTACAALGAACLLSLVTLQRQDAAAQAVDAKPAAEAQPKGSAAAASPTIDSEPAAEPSAAPRETPAWARPEPNVVKGRVVDEAGKPLAGAAVALYRYVGWTDGAGTEQIATQISGEEGEFRFENVVDAAKEFPGGLPDEHFQEQPIPVIAVLGRAAGRAPAWGNDMALMVVKRGHADQLSLKPAATLRGRVTRPDGRPVTGARLTAGLSALPGIDMYSAVTDADGRYAIEDLAAFDAAQRKREMAKAMQNAQGETATWVMSSSAGSNPLMVRHPDFAARRVEIKTIPGELNVELQPGAVVEGVATVRDRDGVAKPAPGVAMQITRVLPEPKPGEAPDAFLYQTTAARTDAQGRYRFDSLPAGRYNLSGQLKGWVTQGVEGVDATGGQTSQAPELVFTRGGAVRIKLIDANSGEALALPAGTRAYINPQRRPRLPLGMFALLPNFAAFTDATAEVQLATGDYAFLIHIPGPTQADPFWQSTNYESFKTDANHAVVEGETIEVTVPMSQQTRRQMASGTWSLVPVAASGESAEEASSDEEPNAYVVPTVEPANDFVPATEPADNQGSSNVGVLDSLNPARAAVGSEGWVLTATENGPGAFVAETVTLAPASAPTTLAATVPESGDGAFDPAAPRGVIFKRADGSASAAATGGEVDTVRRGVVMVDAAAVEEETETTHTATGVGEIALAAIGVPGEAVLEGANSISVHCLDEAGAPLEGVEATLYRMWYRDGKHELIGTAKSDASGEAKFANVVSAERVAEYRAMLAARKYNELFMTNLLVVTRRADLTTAMFATGEHKVVRQGYAADVSLSPGQRLTGRVTAPDGRPVANAVVAAGSMANVVIEGANSVRTDADGRFEFNDRPRFDAAAARAQMPKTQLLTYSTTDAAPPQMKRQPVGADLWASQITVSHPDFAVTQVSGGDIPGTVDVVMDPAAAIAGRVTMAGSGAPVPNMLVRAYGHSDLEVGADGAVVRRTGESTPTRRGGHAAATRTDAEGAYRLGNLPEGVYDVWAQATTDDPAQATLTNTGIAELAARASSEPAVAPNLVVGPGGVLRGQIVDAATGEPLRLPGGGRVTVILTYVGGPRLQDRTSAEAPVSADGKFEARLAPGKAHISLHVDALDAAPDGGLAPAYATADNSYATGPIVEAAHGGEYDATIAVWARAEIDNRRAADREAYELFRAEKWAETVVSFSKIFEQYPDDTSALLGRAMSYERLGDFQKAAADYKEALRLAPGDINSLIRLPALLATSSDAELRDGPRAVELATRLVARVREEGYRELLPESLATLAAAYAEAGDFETAVARQQEAVKLTTAERREEMEARLQLYEAGKPFHRE